ncbi:hypothetical protein SteCoe_9555 [Stentor coeruleus]|uniref:Uncharacterized protein n=1 Tax=Stentor coeruleus TaxID=5963 RepID=A0A1R2CHJ1_9CILI|nr:hypothetical protein SteCoe_9555 [Stentor coeruleus]
MDTLDLDYSGMADFSVQGPMFNPPFLDEISKIESNESREILVKLSNAEVKLSKLAAACKARDAEISRLEKSNSDLKNLLKNTDIEELSLQLQHMQFLNKALEQKFQDSQIKIYNMEKAEKKELKDCKLKIDELEKDKKRLEENFQDVKDQLTMVEYEKNYLQSRNGALEKRLKILENYKDNSAGTELSPKKVVKGRKTSGEYQQNSSLSSALKLFQEFPLPKG